VLVLYRRPADGRSPLGGVTARTMSAAAAAPADRTHSPPRNGPSSAPESGTSVWLNAWHDPVAGLQTHGACVRLVDLYGDGDSKLLVADVGRKLTVFKGVQMISDHALLDVPVAIACYYPDNITPRCPTVGVAAGEHIFIYRNLRPHYRFTVPSVPVAQEETEIWEGLRQQPEPDVEEAIASIARLRDAGTKLTSCSLDLLGIQDTALAYEFVQAEKHTPLAQHASITCMEVLAKSEDSELGMSCLVIGTESRKVYILKHTGYSISCEATLPSVPVLMAVTGSVAVGFRIVVACRDAKVYTIKGSNATAETNVGTSMVIELESQPCGLVRTGKSIIIGCMGNQFHSYHIKGKKNFTVYLPSSITQMELLDMKGVARQVQACIVAMANGEVRVYNGKSLVSTFNCHDQVTALRYGKFGRESNALVLAHKSGALSVKMLPRNVDLEKSKMPWVDLSLPCCVCAPTVWLRNPVSLWWWLRPRLSLSHVAESGRPPSRTFPWISQRRPSCTSSRRRASVTRRQRCIASFSGISASCVSRRRDRTTASATYVLLSEPVG
jgi:Bardet-Biedl syndrome 1 protein